VPAAPTPGSPMVATTDVNVRSGPSITNAVIGVLKGGTQLGSRVQRRLVPTHPDLRATPGWVGQQFLRNGPSSASIVPPRQ